MDLNNYYISAQFSENGYAEVGTDLGVLLDATPEFSLESWIRLSELEPDINILSCENYFRFGVDNEQLVLDIKGLPVISGSTSNSRIDKQDWYHVAVTYNLQHVRLYINGECVMTSSLSGKGSGSPGIYRIGSQMNGKMRSLQIYRKGLSVNEINDSMFGTISDEYLVADFDFTCNPPLDRKTPQREIKLSGEAEILKVYPSLRLSGNAFATPYNKAGVNPGGGNNFDPYTVHAILRVGNLKGRQFIFANSLPQINSGMALYLEYDTEQKKMFVKSLRGSAIDDNEVLVSRSSIPLDKWVSIATVYDGESLRIYIDGEKDAEGEFGPVLIPSQQGNPVIGGRFLGGESTVTDSFQGNISYLEVWDKALSDDEIKEYATSVPAADTPSLVCLFDFSVYHVRNEVDNAPVCMSDGAIIWDYTVPAPKNSEELNVVQNKVTYETTPALLQSFREEVDFALCNDKPFAQSFPEDQLIEELRLLLPEGTDVQATAKAVKERWEEQFASGKLRFQVTQHMKGHEFFIVVHYPEYSYVAYRCKLDQIDECTLYKVGLIFTIVVGIADILLAVRPTLTDRAVRFIRTRILAVPEIVAMLAVGAAITAGQLFSIGRILVSKGLMKELFKIIISFGFWGLIRMAARLILGLLGVGAADMIASLSATAITFTLTFVEYIKHCLPFPSVALYGIKFNHNLAQHQTSALNIRIDETTNIRIPEWTPLHQDPVAYAINQIHAGGVIIHAKFTIGAVLHKTVQIRGNATPTSILGNVEQFACHFTHGTSDYVPLQVAFNGAAIGIQLASWNWEYYDDQLRLWQPMCNSTNTAYLVQDTPLLPWTQNANLASRTLPSEQALQIACLWANGINNVAAIPAQIAHSFYGSNLFDYAGVYAYADYD